MLETLSILCHADSKVGKSTFAATAPPPILVLDAEGSWKFIPLRMIPWDPMQGPPPQYDGTWDACVVSVQNWHTVQAVYQWLSYGGHSFRSLIVDSITEIQRRCKQNLVGFEAMKIQDWGSLLTHMDATIRGFRDLTLHPTNPIQVAVFIAETRQNQSGKYIPYMQGQISIALPYWMDIVGYLFVQPILDANGQMSEQKIRRLLITPNPQFEAGERVQGRLGEIVDPPPGHTGPSIWHMLFQVFPQLAAQVQSNGQAA